MESHHMDRSVTFPDTRPLSPRAHTVRPPQRRHTSERNRRRPEHPAGENQATTFLPGEDRYSATPLPIRGAREDEGFSPPSPQTRRRYSENYPVDSRDVSGNYSGRNWETGDSLDNEMTIRQLQDRLKENQKMMDLMYQEKEELKTELVKLKYFTDPYAGHKTPDSEIECQYRGLISMVAQTARDLCTLKEYRTDALLHGLHSHPQQTPSHRPLADSDSDDELDVLPKEFLDPKELQIASAILRRREKHGKRSAIEMLIFRRLEHLVLPPKRFSAGLSHDENKQVFELLAALEKRLKSHGEVCSPDQLSKLEKWRLDTLLYINSDSSVPHTTQKNKEKAFQILCLDFGVPLQSEIFRPLITTSFEFAQLLQTQKNIYGFKKLVNRFDMSCMDFQDPQQSEWRDENLGAGEQKVLLSVYPALMKRTANAPGYACMAKGKALFEPPFLEGLGGVIQQPGRTGTPPDTAAYYRPPSRLDQARMRASPTNLDSAEYYRPPPPRSDQPMPAQRIPPRQSPRYRQDQ